MACSTEIIKKEIRMDVLTSKLPFNIGPACAKYNVEAESKINSIGSRLTVNVSTSMQFKKIVILLLNTLSAILVHFLAYAISYEINFWLVE